MNKCVTIGLIIVFAAACASAASTNLLAGAAEDIALRGPDGTPIPAGSVDAFRDGGQVYILNWRATAFGSFYNEVGHELTLHAADGGYIRTLAADAVDAYKSFVVRHGPDVYYGLGDDIYRVDYAGTSAPVVAASLGNVFDMQFDSDGTAYAVANPGWAGNAIFRVDLTGGSDPVKVIDHAGLFSAELGVDAADNLYYATYGLGTDELRRFSEAELDAVSGSPLEFADGEKLTDLACGAGGLEVDDAGNVVFSMNSPDPSYHALCVISSGKDYSAYGGERYDLLSEGRYWMSNVDAVGDVLAYAGSPEQAAFAVGGGTLSIVPEPTAGALWLAVGAAGLLRRRRRREREDGR